LLQAGAKVTAQDTHGNSPIHNASYHNSIAALELLLAQSDAVGALLLRTSEGDSALDYACGNNHLTAAEALLRAGAMVNDADSRRWTALHNACATYHPNALPLINALLEAGADPTLTNSDGMRPIDLTQDNPIRAVLKRRIDAILADEEFLDGGVEF
jgi:ankyrin repeat protein